VAWGALGIDEDTIAAGDDGTIAPPVVVISPPSSALPLLVVGSGDTAPFLIGATIGEGGMGIVRLAEQRSLEREVAVKTLRGSTEDHRAVTALVREARVTGALEHPNVIPVHALGRDADGRPMIVMKRVEGRSWREALHEDGGAVSGDTLARHLRILVQVANAVHFAHDRGILHRDLKPDNVMLGEFGEVYVVDWGIAVALRGDVLSDMPLARDVRHVAGTPQYMAPEMAAGAGDELGPQSDVYLLGAILHELFVGAPPHHGASIRGMLAHAFASEPHPYPDAAPELAAICHRAMSVAPAERFANASALAHAIEAFLDHRSSTSVSNEATRRLVELQTRIEDDADRAEIYASFSAARFGFRQALEIWQANDPAHAGLTKCLTRMVGYELDAGSGEAAEALLAELPSADEALGKRVRSAADQARARGRRIAQLEHDHDRTIGDAERRVSIWAMGGTWVVFGGVSGWLQRTGRVEISNLHLAVVFLSMLAIAYYGFHKWADRMLATDLQRRMVFVGPVVIAGYSALFGMAHAVDMSLFQGFVMLHVLSIVASALAALLVDRRVWPMAGVNTASLGVILLWPTYLFEITGLSACIGCLVLGILYAKPAA